MCSLAVVYVSVFLSVSLGLYQCIGCLHPYRYTHAPSHIRMWTPGNTSTGLRSYLTAILRHFEVRWIIWWALPLGIAMCQHVARLQESGSTQHSDDRLARIVVPVSAPVPSFVSVYPSVTYSTPYGADSLRELWSPSVPPNCWKSWTADVPRGLSCRADTWVLY